MNTLTRSTLAMAAVLTIFGCADRPAATGVAPQVITAEPTTAKVERRDIVGYELLPGTLYTPPEAVAHVYPPYRAPVERVLTQVGDEVRRGEVIVELSFPNAEMQLQQAQASLNAAQSAYNSARVQYEAPVREARRALADAQATERAMRQQTLPGGDASELVAARQAREAAQDALMAAQAEARANMLPYQQQLDAARQTHTEARAGARMAAIRAPISGTVTELNVTPGTEIGQNAKAILVTVVDLGALQIKSELLPDQAGVVKERTRVVLSFRELPQQNFEGVVSRMRVLPAKAAPGADAPARHEATIDFDNKENAVRPNMTVVSVGVKVGEVKDVLAVPAAAVYRDPTGKPTVRVLVGETWTPRIVEPGLTDGQYTQIKSGLELGETVQVPAVR